MNFYKALLRPLLFRLDPEDAHNFTFTLARLFQRLPILPGLLQLALEVKHLALSQELCGMHFANPVGVAAGFDKNARLGRFWEALGFGYIEFGSVTAQPSEGNPRPRLFRLEQDQALINRMGLNNWGVDRVLSALKPPKVVCGVNVIKTHDPTIVGERALQDILYSLDRALYVGDYITLNISCPNTAEGKTFENPEDLNSLLKAVFRKQIGLPLLIKFSPDLEPEQLGQLLDLCLQFPVNGFVLTNTTSGRSGLSHCPGEIERIGRGGLSGRPLQARVVEIIRFARMRVGPKPLIVGVGGVDSAQSAYALIRAGANLVQVYTGLVYQGPTLVRDINRGLLELLKRDNFASLAEACGADAKL